jgi:DNA primase
MPAIDYREARARLRLAAVLELLGYEPRWRQGEQIRGPCPLHGSGSPTSRVFAAHLGKNVYHCFRCGAGGNALDLWAAVRHLALHAAVLELCQRLGQEVPWLQRPRGAGQHSAGQTSKETKSMPAP